MNPTALAGQIASLDKSYNPTATYNKLTTQLGIPDARTQVQQLQSNLVNTQNAINAVPTSVQGRTSGSLVTDAQRGALVNEEQAPLNSTYTQQNQSLGTDNTNLNNLLSQLTQQAQLAQTNYTDKRQSLSDQLASAQKAQEDAQAKAQAAASLAEQKREADMTQATAMAKASSSSAAAASKPLSQTQTAAAIRSGLEKVKGGDNHVAPKDLATAYNDWLKSGYTAKTFWSNFQGYWNPKQSNYSQAFYAAV